MNERVLVLDDDLDFVKLVTLFLRQAGFVPSSATDAMQGVTAARREQPAVILLDLQMPGGGGYVLHERLQLSSRTRSIPVVVVTGETSPEVERTVRQKGIAGFLRKPVDRDSIIAAVRDALGSSAEADLR